MNDDEPRKAAAEIPGAETKVATAWHPFTPRGVAAFALAPFSRVLFLQTLVAILAAAVVVWFLHANYVPSIAEAIGNLPNEAAFQNGTITNIASGVLTEKQFLSIVVDLEETGRTGQTADVQIELRRGDFQICSLLGCGLFYYPGESFVIGRSVSEPWWGARRPVILALCGALAFAGIWAAWILLGLFYAPVAKFMAYFNDRELTWGESWRLAGAAQASGALLASLAILCYGLQAFDFIQFIFFFGLHLFVPWFYLFASPLTLPAISTPDPVTQNPFVPGGE